MKFWPTRRRKQTSRPTPPEPPRLTPEQQRQLASFPVQRIAHADQLQQQRNKGEAR